MDKLCIISGDGHAGAPVADYKPYMPSKYWPDLKRAETEEREFKLVTEGQSHFPEEALAVADTRGVIRGGGQSGAWDPARRLREMDAEGVVAEVIHQGHQFATMPFYSIVNRPHSAELRMVGAQAYHRWLADHMAQTNGRTFGVADPGPCTDMPATLRELQWLADNGFVSVGVPGNVADKALPPLYHSYYEPFWTFCEELDLSLSIHAGWGLEQGLFFKFAEAMTGGESIEEAAKDGKFIAMGEALKNSRRSPNALGMEPRRAMWQLMFGGVFDRHPRLKLVMTEIRAEWLPATLNYLDAQFEHFNGQRPRKKPSQYFAEHCYITPSSPKVEEIQMRHDIGVSRLMFGSDYPHPEGTWPNTWQWLATIFDGVPDGEMRQILGGNAIEAYGLDRAKMMRIAEDIGPTPEEVRASLASVSPALINDFDRRGLFKVPPEVVETHKIDQLLRQDLASLTN